MSKKLEVGSKWKSKRGFVVTIDYVCFDRIVFTDEIGNEFIVYTEHFLERYTPYIEFKWEKWDKVIFEKIVQGERVVEVTLYTDKDFELLYNYKRYRTEVDTTELDWGSNPQPKWYNYYYNKQWRTTYNRTSQFGGTRYFSTEAHAKAFLKLAKENGCL